MFQTNHLYLDQAVQACQAHIRQEAKAARLEPIFRWLKHLLVPRPGAQMRHPQPT